MIEKGGDFKEVIVRTHPSVNEFENGGSIMNSKRVIKLLYFVRLFICYIANKSFPLFPPLLARRVQLEERLLMIICQPDTNVSCD